jgi:hypothetical protein
MGAVAESSRFRLASRVGEKNRVVPSVCNGAVKLSSSVDTRSCVRVLLDYCSRSCAIDLGSASECAMCRPSTVLHGRAPKCSVLPVRSDVHAVAPETIGTPFNCLMVVCMSGETSHSLPV